MLLGLPIFEPRDGGAGSSNDGNTARRALRDHSDLLASECNVPIEFIQGIYVIWIALASNLPICPQKFGDYCKKIKNIYVENLNWYHLSPSLHRILEHGSEIIQLFPKTLTSGHLSEEPAESSNKDVKSYQTQHSRQNDPTLRNIDVFHRMLDRSDPKISNHVAFDRKNKRKRSEVFPNAVMALLKDSKTIEKDFHLTVE